MDDPREVDGLKTELAAVRAKLAAMEAERAAWGHHFEDLLESGNRNYCEIFDAVKTAVCVHEMPSGRILDSNQAVLDMFGCSRDETLDPAFWNRVTLGPPYDAKAAVALINRAATEGTQTVQWPLRRIDGTEFWVESTLKRAVIGGVPCVVSLTTDITQRRRAERELAENRRKLSNAMSIAKLGYWEYDVARDEFTFDDHFFAIFHTTAEKVGGYTMPSARYAKLFVPPDEVHRVADEIEIARNADDPNFSRYLEHRIIYADGGVGYIAVRHFVVKDEQGRTIKTYGANQDITDRRRAEEALRASEQNYREIFNGTMNAIFVHEIPSGRIVDVNQTALDMFGCSRDEATQMSFWRRVSVGPPYTPAAAIRLIRRATIEGEQVAQWPVRHRNGEQFWIEVVVKQALIGGVPRVLVLLNDITRRRRSEDALRNSEQNYRELFNATMNAIFVHEIPSGRIVDVNQTMLDMFGMTYEEALSSSVEDISLGVPPYSQQEAVALVNKSANEGPQRFEWHCRRKDGSAFWAEMVLKRAIIGGVPRVLALANDVTDRKRAEEALKTSEQNYREIFNASANPIGLVDGETGRFVDVNQAMLDMHGLSREEALKMTMADFSVDQSPETQQRALELLRRVIEDGPHRFEWHCRRADGSPLWMDVTAQRAMIGGRPHILAVASDITERTEARQRLLQERQTLRQLLESQERERRLIAYEIHDGLAQQLAAAAMYCSVFDQLRETSPEEAAKSHEAGAIMLQKALAEARRLIGGLRPAVLDESGLVAAVKSLIEEVEAREGIEVEFDAEVQFVRLDPVWENSLFRIVQESLNNAARYSGTSRMRVQLSQEADRLKLEIQDWGRGFDPSTVRDGRFGLKGIRERAALLGGEAVIESAPGEGTRIYVDLPVEEAPASSSPLSPGEG